MHERAGHDDDVRRSGALGPGVLGTGRQGVRGHHRSRDPDRHGAGAGGRDLYGHRVRRGQLVADRAHAGAGRRGIELPDTTRRTFRLDGARWETPGPDDAEALVESLVRAGIVVRDRLLVEVLRGHRPAVSGRTVERRFRAATGLTQGAVRQIERARTAARLLAAGDPATDVVAELDYFDEPHLARALRSYVGRTVRQLREGAGGAIALDLDQRLTS
jgi:hypothetical protein